MASYPGESARAPLRGHIGSIQTVKICMSRFKPNWQLPGSKSQQIEKMLRQVEKKGEKKDSKKGRCKEVTGDRLERQEKAEQGGHLWGWIQSERNRHVFFDIGEYRMVTVRN